MNPFTSQRLIHSNPHVLDYAVNKAERKCQFHDVADFKFKYHIKPDFRIYHRHGPP